MLRLSPVLDCLLLDLRLYVSIDLSDNVGTLEELMSLPEVVLVQISLN